MKKPPTETKLCKGLFRGKYILIITRVTFLSNKALFQFYFLPFEANKKTPGKTWGLFIWCAGEDSNLRSHKGA